jgi:hypothetical protein
MNTKAIQDLRKIMKIEGLSRKDGLIAREKALEHWLNIWIEEISISQSIIKNNLTKEDKALITQHIIDTLSESLMENCVYLEQTPNKIEVKMYGIKR